MGLLRNAENTGLSTYTSIVPKNAVAEVMATKSA